MGDGADNKPVGQFYSHPIYCYSTLDTPEKITLDQLKRADAAHIEILENVDTTPEGFLRYDTIDPTRPNTPPKARIEVSSDTVRAGILSLRGTIHTSTLMTRLPIITRECLTGEASHGIGEMALLPLSVVPWLITFAIIPELMQ
ncbi:MAG: hypothetical protein JXA73_01665 [Acidobacteria bacterium]|nr:hypothetical protein [Acidobacteriota bacterium]